MDLFQPRRGLTTSVAGGSDSAARLSVTVNTRVVAPMRNLERCSSWLRWMLLLDTKVPFVVPRSIRVAVEPFTSIAQCFRETSGSYRTISAPERPKTIRGLLKRKTWPLPGPSMTARATVCSAGSWGSSGGALTLKLEWHCLHGTCSLDSPANCFSFTVQFAPQWGHSTIMLPCRNASTMLPQVRPQGSE